MPVLADWLTRPWIVVNSELICAKALSAVEIILLAIWLLEMAWFVLAMSLVRASLAIKPDGSSAPELIRLPVLNCVSARLQIRVRRGQRLLRKQRTDVGVNTGHATYPSKKGLRPSLTGLRGDHVSGSSFAARRQDTVGLIGAARDGNAKKGGFLQRYEGGNCAHRAACQCLSRVPIRARPSYSHSTARLCPYGTIYRTVSEW